jgi:hypothetical protein
MEQLQYQDKEKLVDVKVLQLSTKSSAGTLLNGSMKSLMIFNIRDYIDFESDPTIDYVEVALPYACIPNSSYNISSKNNHVDISYNGLTYIYTFPSGNYTAQTFMTTWATVVPVSFVITYNSTTSKFTIKNATYSFSLLSTSTLDYVIGFSGQVDSTLVSTYNTIVCPRCVDFLPEPVYNICCPEIANGQALANGGSFQFSNILATIPNSGKLNVQTVYQNTGDDFILKTSSYNQLTIQILSDEGAYIDFNGLASFFALRFKIHRKYAKVQGTFSDIVQRSTKLRLLAELAQQEEEE